MDGPHARRRLFGCGADPAVGDAHQDGGQRLRPSRIGLGVGGCGGVHQHGHLGRDSGAQVECAIRYAPGRQRGQHPVCDRAHILPGGQAPGQLGGGLALGYAQLAGDDGGRDRGHCLGRQPGDPARLHIGALKVPERALAGHQRPERGAAGGVRQARDRPPHACGPAVSGRHRRGRHRADAHLALHRQPGAGQPQLALHAAQHLRQRADVQRREMRLLQRLPDVSRELVGAQRGVGLVDLADLRPGRLHQQLLILLRDPRAQARDHAVHGMGVQLREPVVVGGCNRGIGGGCAEGRPDGGLRPLEPRIQARADAGQILVAGRAGAVHHLAQFIALRGGPARRLGRLARGHGRRRHQGAAQHLQGAWVAAGQCGHAAAGLAGVDDPAADLPGRDDARQALGQGPEVARVRGAELPGVVAGQHDLRSRIGRPVPGRRQRAAALA